MCRVTGDQSGKGKETTMFSNLTGVQATRLFAGFMMTVPWLCVLICIAFNIH